MKLFVLSVFLLTSGVSAHPQCLDGKPPFTPTPKNKFCSEYKQIGCCTNEEDAELAARFKKLRSKVPKECKPYMKTLLCQKCSPYAAHLFSFETNGIADPSPGLCPDYCEKVYKACGKKGLRKLSKDPKFTNAITRKKKFCAYSTLDDPQYCYPNLKSDPTLSFNFTRLNNDSEGCMCFQTIAEGHGLITTLKSNPTTDTLLYVGEHRGIIYVYEELVLHSTPFLNLSDRVHIQGKPGGEGGFLGMAFHPDFGTNRQFFVYYTAMLNGSLETRLSRFKAPDDLKANENSERILLTIAQPSPNHNGGPVLFGDDGYLYLMTGDGGGGGGDPENRAQPLNTLFGKVLRIKVNPRGNSYTIPQDNPYVGRSDAREEIYANGLRNPWGCSVDVGDPDTKAGKGRIFCGDVGQARFEEINIIVNGGNYGWSAREGFECFKPDLCGNIGPEELPIHAYNHTVGRAAVGGFVYRGCEYPPYVGSFFFGDFATGKLFRLQEEADNSWNSTEIKLCSNTTCSGNWVPTYGRGITTFGTNQRGDIYLSSTSDFSAFGTGGNVYKIVMQPFRRQDPSPCDPDSQN